MSYAFTSQNILRLDMAVQERFEDGDPLTIDALGNKPKLLIHSFDPLAYEQFGVLSNRAPSIVGTLALRALLVAPGSTGARVYLGAQTDQVGYGFAVTNAEQLNDIAEIVELSGGFQLAEKV